MANTNVDIASIESLINEILPALGPYGPAIALGVSVLENVAPAVYQEVGNLISQIKSGDTVTTDDLAKLTALISNLENPDQYFNAAGQLTPATPPTP